METGTILVVEDEMSIRTVIQTYLESAGYTAVCIDNGRDALVQAELHQPVLVILDLNLPGIDGMKVAVAALG